MNVEVTKDNVIILKDSQEPHKEEYRITKCYFTFDEFTDSFPNKIAVFTVLSTNESFDIDIIDNECDIPNEVLKHEYETVKLGVYGYDIETIDNEEVLKQRFSPSYDTFTVPTGSYVDGAKSPEMITPSQYDIYSAKLQEGLDEIDAAVAEIETMDIDAEKVGKTSTVTITRKDGTVKEVTLEDGMGLNYDWDGTSLGVKREDESVYEYVDLKGDTGAPGAVKFIIVETLPIEDIQTDALYLVPKEDPTTQDLYDEYMYVDNKWELLGEKQIVVDLTDYVKNTDYATSSKGGVIKSGYYGLQVDSTNGKAYCDTYTYANYGNVENQRFISKGTLENVITGKGLVSSSDLTDYVQFTDYASQTNAGVFKAANMFFIDVASNDGYLRGMVKNYNDYSSGSNYGFISKGTLENVITGKGLITNTVNNLTNYYTKTEIDTMIGNIDTLLTTLNTGSGV